MRKKQSPPKQKYSVLVKGEFTTYIEVESTSEKQAKKDAIEWLSNDIYLTSTHDIDIDYSVEKVEVEE